MKTIMSSMSSRDSSFSFSRRYFNWRKKIVEEGDSSYYSSNEEEAEPLAFNSCHFSFSSYDELREYHPKPATKKKKKKKLKKLPEAAVSKLRSALNVFHKPISSSSSSGLGTKVIGTLFGYRRGHVHFAFQEDAKLSPAFLIELATPTSVLVKEMASGLVRIALECERKPLKKPGRLLEEPIWRTYCNGRKCGYATRRECRPEEWKVLKAVEPISMGAGVLPGRSTELGGGDVEGELMYMRARFERVVGSKDSEAFYMMNPDGSGGPELSFYLLRV